jgi:hypothetical protein
MAVRERPRVAGSPDTIVLPEARRVAIGTRRPAWLDRPEAPWFAALAVAAVAMLLLVLFLPDGGAVEPATAPPVEVDETDLGVSTATPWDWLGRPVPDELRSGTIDVLGGEDLLAIAAAGFGSVAPLTGSPVTGDGPTVAQVFDDRSFSVVATDPVGTTVPIVVVVPYPPDATVLAPGERVTFQGTLLPATADLSAIVGSEAASVASRTDVYVLAVPITVDRVVAPA